MLLNVSTPIIVGNGLFDSIISNYCCDRIAILGRTNNRLFEEMVKLVCKVSEGRRPFIASPDQKDDFGFKSTSWFWRNKWEVTMIPKWRRPMERWLENKESRLSVRTFTSHNHLYYPYKFKPLQCEVILILVSWSSKCVFVVFSYWWSVFCCTSFLYCLQCVSKNDTHISNILYYSCL